MIFRNCKNRQKKYNENSQFFADFYQLFYLFNHDGKGGPPQKIAITSAVQGEGKSTVALYMALTGSLCNCAPVLLVDGDFRRPSLHTRFGLKRENGLTEALLSEIDFDSIAKTTNIPNLHFVPSGKSIPNPVHLLNLKESAYIFNHLAGTYTAVIVDCPPVIPVSDTLRLSQLVDGVILVVRAGNTPREVVKRALHKLQDARARVLGVVLNDLGQVLPYYYQNKYYHYHSSR